MIIAPKNAQNLVDATLFSRDGLAAIQKTVANNTPSFAAIQAVGSSIASHASKLRKEHPRAIAVAAIGGAAAVGGLIYRFTRHKAKQAAAKALAEATKKAAAEAEATQKAARTRRGGVPAQSLTDRCDEFLKKNPQGTRLTAESFKEFQTLVIESRQSSTPEAGTVRERLSKAFVRDFATVCLNNQ